MIVLDTNLLSEPLRRNPEPVVLEWLAQPRESFAGTVPSYDERAARAYAELKQRSRNTRRPIGVEDGMIAAICIANGAPLDTRNVKDVAGLGIVLVNPWDSPTR